MGDTLLKCPLCCSQSFSSKSELIEHLTQTNDNIACPICLMKWSSVWHLIEHLSDDNCQLEVPEEALSSNVDEDNEGGQTFISNFEETHVKLLDLKSLPTEYDKDSIHDPFASVKENSNGALEMSPMYVELLSKQTAKPCLQTQELKLVKDGGISRYVIVTDQNADLDAESTIVTKQNNDGTISLTTVRDMKMEPDTVITQENQEAEKSQEEIYSCNTCGVSFTSVLEHIKNYHNDQDVVVEEPMDEETGMGTISLEFNEDGDGMVQDFEKQQPRRMITETGDIVEAPILKSFLETNVVQPEEPQIKEDVIEKKGKGRKRFVMVDKFCDSIIMDISDPSQKDSKKGPFHKVVIKEVDTTTGDKMKVFNCISCNVYASSLEQFKSHPCKALRYSCPYCMVSYENSKSLCAHMKVHKNKSPTSVTGSPEASSASFACEFCSTVFVTNKSLKLHKRMHDPVKVRPIEPPVEGAEGGQASNKKFLCTVCDKMIPLDYRTIHQNSHKGLDKYNCDICNKKFTSGDYLEMHMTVHNSEKVQVNKQDKYLPYTCLYCDRKFARPHEKVKHERIHTGEKPHACEICGKSFRVSYCLTLHMRTHTGARPYSCPHCGKRFKAHSVYNHHLLTHSEVRAYKCPYCPKAFKTSVQLAGHKNSHTKPFSCQICNRPFASLYAVRVHTETHARQNNLKYSCALCGASYARAFALNDHVKQAHSEETKELAVVSKDDTKWVQETADGDLDISKKLPHEIEINELGISGTELIVP